MNSPKLKKPLLQFEDSTNLSEHPVRTYKETLVPVEIGGPECPETTRCADAD